MLKKGVIVLLCLSTIAMFGFGGLKTKKDMIAKVGGEVITLEELNARLDAYPDQYKQAFAQKENKVKVLDQMIDEEILLLVAKKSKYNKKEDFKQQIDEIKNRLLITFLIQDKIDSQAAVSAEEVKKYFDDNKAQFGPIERRKARHILVKTEPEASKILSSIKKGGNFSELAKKHSLDPTAANGGDIGWFIRGQLVPEFDKAAFSLKKGQLSSVVKTQFGYHIIMLDDISQRPALSFNEVKDRIQQTLLAQKKQQLTQDLISTYKEKVKITRDISKI
ncbi:peptidylprolyl isomerase [Thermoproteota archaeon]